MSRATQYVIGDEAAFIRVGNATMPSGLVIECAWHWTADRRKATRFEGRNAAEAFAERAEAGMASGGYPDVKLSISPASGGVAIARRIAR